MALREFPLLEEIQASKMFGRRLIFALGDGNQTNEKEVKDIMGRKAGFHSGKWTSNEVEALKALMQPFVQYTITATNVVNCGFIGLSHGSTPILIDVPAPGKAGKLLIIRDNSASGTEAHVATALGGTFDGTNNTATFNAPGEQLILYSISSTVWIIVLNSGAVAMSSA